MYSIYLPFVPIIKTFLLVSMLRIVTSEVIVSSAVVFICSHRSHGHIDTSAVSPDWTLGTFSILVSSISQKCSVLRGPEVAAAAQLRVMSLPWTN